MGIFPGQHQKTPQGRQISLIEADVDSGQGLAWWPRLWPGVGSGRANACWSRIRSCSWPWVGAVLAVLVLRRRLDAYLTRADLALRSRTLGRLLYESAARAEEVLLLGAHNLIITSPAVVGQGSSRSRTS